MRRPLQHSAAVKCAVSLSSPAAHLAVLSHHMVEGAQQAIWSGSDAFRLHLTAGVEAQGTTGGNRGAENLVTRKVGASVLSVPKWSRMVSVTESAPWGSIRLVIV